MENRSFLSTNIKSDNSRKQSLTYSSASGTKVTFVVETLKPFNTMSIFVVIFEEEPLFVSNALVRFARYRGYQAVSGRNI